jgi:hypothetical protein
MKKSCLYKRREFILFTVFEVFEIIRQRLRGKSISWKRVFFENEIFYVKGTIHKNEIYDSIWKIFI